MQGEYSKDASRPAASEALIKPAQASPWQRKVNRAEAAVRMKPGRRHGPQTKRGLDADRATQSAASPGCHSAAGQLPGPGPDSPRSKSPRCAWDARIGPG